MNRYNSEHYFNLYVLVGGMPDPVWAYINSNDTQDMRKRQKSIVSLYQKDITRSTEPTFPVGLSEERSMFKLYQSDVGLLFSQLSGANVQAILQAHANINYGSVYENAVAQELRAHGHTLRYYKTEKYGEVDFLLEYDTPELTLLEVKSGKQSNRHKALDNLMNVENYAIREALVLHTDNVRTDGKVVYLPVYMAAFL